MIRHSKNSPVPTRQRVSPLRVIALLGVCGLSAASAVVTKEAVSRTSLQPLAKVEAPSVLETARPLETAAGAPVTDPLAASFVGPAEATVDDLIAAANAPVAEPEVVVAAEPQPEQPKYADAEIRYFNGRACRPARTIVMTVTAYSPDWRSCGDSADGITSSLHRVETNGMKLVAADSRVLPLGSMISVPGYDDGRIVPVLDRGGAIKGHRLDVLYPTHESALKWGVQKLKVTVWEYADGQPADDFRAIRDSRN